MTENNGTEIQVNLDLINELRVFLDQSNNYNDIKEKISDFFNDVIDVEKDFLYIITEKTKYSNVGHVPGQIFREINQRYNRDVVWTTVSSNELKDHFWWICREGNKIYIFEFPENEFNFDDFGITKKTRAYNDGFRNARYYHYDLYKGNRGIPPQYPSVDIVLDLNNFDELLGSTDKNFKQYLRVELDLDDPKLLIYPPKNNVTDKEYEQRRKELLESLTEEQTNAAKTDKKASLINAGAGCGKTTTLIGRIIYLIKEKEIKSPDDLLLVAFNRKNRLDFVDKLTKYGLIEYAKKSAHTFHSLGRRIIRATGDTAAIFDQEIQPLDRLLNLFIDPNNTDAQDPSIKTMCEKIINDVKNELKNENWKKNMYLWSSAELPEIPEYDDMGQLNPEYTMYMNLYNFVPDQKQRELVARLDKARACLDITHYNFDDNNVKKMRFLNWLLLAGYDNITVRDDYIQIDGIYKNFDWEKYDSFDQTELPVNCLSKETIQECIENAETRFYMKEFRDIAKQFISLCKIHNNTNFDDIEKKILTEFSKETEKKHIEGFFSLIKPVYDLYEKFLGSRLDFNDMINKSIDKLEDKEHPLGDELFKYKYIFVDEFQDVAYDNFKLIKLLKERNNAYLTCVGDDWQAIYSWRGSNLYFFKDFKTCFGLKKEEFGKFNVTTTHRYGKNLVDVSNDFIRTDENEKELKVADNPKETKLIEWRGNWNNLIKKIEKDYGNDISVKVLQRRRPKSVQIARDLRSRFEGQDTTDVMTIHKSKGLEADVVIIKDLQEGVFPSNKQPDIILQGLQNVIFEELKEELFDGLTNDEKIEKEKLFNSVTDSNKEERRLFYVALTRAKKVCYFYKPSGRFWNEIVNKNRTKIEREGE